MRTDEDSLTRSDLWRSSNLERLENSEDNETIIELPNETLIEQPSLALADSEVRRVYQNLEALLEEIGNPCRPSENAATLIAKAFFVVAGFASSKVYFTGSVSAFPKKPGLGYSTAVCGAITSAFPTIWAAFDVINGFKSDSDKKEAFLNLKKDLYYYTHFIFPSLYGGLAPVPTAALTYETSKSDRWVNALWSGDALIVEGALSIFSMQRLMAGASCQANVTEEDKLVLHQARKALLSRLQKERPNFLKWKRTLVVEDILNFLRHPSPENSASGWTLSFLKKLGRLIVLAGLSGYTSVTYDTFDKMFEIDNNTADALTKIVLTLLAMIPFTNIMLIGVESVFEGIYNIVKSTLTGRFSELLKKHPAYQLLPNVFMAGSIAIIILALGSGVTNGDTTQKKTPAFIDTIVNFIEHILFWLDNDLSNIDSDGFSDGTPLTQDILSDIFGACAYATSVMFNGFGSLQLFWLFLEWLSGFLIQRNWLVPTILVSEAEATSSENRQNSGEQTQKLYGFIKRLTDFDELISTLERLPLDECVLLLNLDKIIKKSILKEARINSEVWQDIVNKIRTESTEQNAQVEINPSDSDRTRLLSTESKHYGFFGDVTSTTTEAANLPDMGATGERITAREAAEDQGNGFWSYAAHCGIM